MSGASKGIAKAEVQLRWDPSPSGAASHDLDIIAATYRADDPHGEPVYLVHFDRRSPDGTITLSRDSTTGQGFGYDEVMTFELGRLADTYGRVVVGVAIQQRGGHKTFGDVPGTRVRVTEGHIELAQDDLASVAGANAATVAEFTRDGAAGWTFRTHLRGFEVSGPDEFTRLMGAPAA
ncbi:TerD family protein [Streptomyces marincola]|uniref:TerD-family protein n=1 Tax=Streptomyces marincola TaxID=2878388 RepID=A0A1W7CY17_9ACTN|nr:TerD family protein [Streptomyces marincola]ARQ69597.1 TerD-family protein [Streptomyces marincola]